MPEPDLKTKRVLIYRLGSLGDMVVALPALHLVARAFPQAERRLLTNRPVHAKAPAAQAVLADTGLIADTFDYVVGERNLLALLRLWWSVWRWRPEVAVYLAAARGVEAARRDARFLRLCGVRSIVGLPLTAAMQHNFYGADTEAACADSWEPEAQRLARCLAALGDAKLDDAASWDLRLSAAEHAAAAAAIGTAAMSARPLAVSVGTKVQAKDWGVENWRALLQRLAPVAHGRSLLLIGAAEEGAASDYAASDWQRLGGGEVVNLCGRLAPRQSAAALARALVFLGHDSGPMHLAAAVGTPCVAVFAARNRPRQWFPFGPEHTVIYHGVSCWGCGLETCVVERRRCLASITVDEVFAAAKTRLDAMMGNEEGDA